MTTFPTTSFTATRPSTLAGALDDKGGLFTYMGATALQAISRSRAFLDRLAMTDSEDWRDYRDIYEDAQTQRGTPEAEHGTNVHAAIERIINGTDPSRIPARLRADALAALDALSDAGLTPVVSEQRVVTAGLPELLAGTRDLLVTDVHGNVFVGDIKTVRDKGASKYKSVSWAIQLAVYARGNVYDGPDFPRDRWGRPIVDPSFIDLAPHDVSPTTGFVVEVVRDSAVAVVHEIDLVKGWAAAEFACQVRDLRKQSAVVRTFPRKAQR
jgi:hypothetical protein